MGKKDAAAAGSHSNGANGVSNGKKGAKSENGKSSHSVTHNDADNGNQVRHVKLQHPNGITDDLDHTKPLASPWPRIVSLIVITVGLRFALSQVIAPIVAPQGDGALSAVSIATRVVEVIGAISIILRVIEAVLLGIILGNAKGAHHDPAYDEQKGWTFQNWSQIHTFHPKTVEYPANLEELKAIVTKHGRAGRHIKPAGALHSWSACAVTDDVSLVTGRLNRVLSVDKAKKLVTAEAGIRLRDLYASIDKQGLAFATLPNVDIILLGGAVSNATHGTNFDVGTFSSQITEMQMVIFRSKPGRPQSEGEAELVTISKSDNGKEGRRWLEAAVASFGSLGVIYSITMQCCDPYVAYVREFGVTQAEMQGHVLEMIRAYPAMQVQVWTKPESVNYVCKIQNRFSGALIKPDTKLLWTDGDLFTVKLLFFAFQPNAKTYLWLRKLIGTFYNALTSQTNLMTQTLKRRDVAGVMHWSDAELVSRFVAVVSTSPWTNLEYAIPADKIDLACERLNAVMRKHPSLGTYSIRPVGADEIGYLSPTYGRPTCYIDVPYFKDLDEKGSYAEVEKALLDLGGRCSWSRLFKAKTSDVIAQFPRAKEFVQVKNEMDPFNVFSNQFSDSILFPQKK